MSVNFGIAAGAVMVQSFRGLATSGEGESQGPISERQRREKFELGYWVLERVVNSPSGSELSPA